MILEKWTSAYNKNPEKKKRNKNPDPTHFTKWNNSKWITDLKAKGRNIELLEDIMRKPR